MTVNSSYGTKAADFVKRENATGTRIDSGPFIGKVKNNSDAAKLGRIMVYIPELGGLDEENPINWRTLSYSSPFFGQTNQAVKNDNFANECGAVKESYGFWMTPPDIGGLVICIFINGEPDKGYYIGCIPDPVAHHMVPAIAGSAVAKVSSLTQSQIADTDGATYLPVVEFNENVLGNVMSADVYGKVEKPVHNTQMHRFAAQGLINDRVRGVISSSSQRESPSAVYGFSTPGRKISGSTDNPSEVWTREGGHTLVMDDGDAAGDDKLVRLRTSAGHQIMMNDSAGIIYIVTASGNSWVEMGADGSIRAYSGADISLHAAGNVNLNAGGSFNVSASSINLKSAAALNMESGANTNINAKGNLVQFAGGNIKLGASRLEVMAASAAIGCSGELSLVGNMLKLNSGPAPTVTEPAAIPAMSIIPAEEPWARPSGTVQTSDSDELKPAPPSRKIANGMGQGNDATKTATTTSKVSTAELLAVQPNPNGTIGILTKDEVKVLFANIGQSESHGNYQAVNSIGYSGKYQFGVAALETLGYVKSGTWKTYRKNSILSSDAVWTGKDGISSQSDWLNNKAVQEAVMMQNTTNNYKILLRIGGLRQNDEAATVAGVLKVAHLLGAGGAKDWRNGKDSADAYGTTGSKYYAQAERAIKTLTSNGSIVA